MNENWKRFCEIYYQGKDPCAMPPLPKGNVWNLFRGTNRQRRMYYYVRNRVRRFYYTVREYASKLRRNFRPAEKQGD